MSFINDWNPKSLSPGKLHILISATFGILALAFCVSPHPIFIIMGIGGVMVLWKDLKNPYGLIDNKGFWIGVCLGTIVLTIIILLALTFISKET